MLTLAEELLLLCINDEKGTIQNSALPSLHIGLAAALLAELSLEGRIGIEDGVITVLNDAPTYDELMNEALFKIVHSDRPRKPGYWIQQLGKNYDLLQNRLISAMITMGVLRREGKRLLWIIPYDIYPQRNASAKYWIKQTLRDAVLMNDASVDQRTTALLSLLHALKILDLVFTKDERKAARHRIEEIVKDDIFGQVVAETIAAIDLAAAKALMATVSN